jgi:hypothetical protein
MSSNHPAIRVSHLSKQYKLGGREEPYHTLRDAIVNSFKAPMKIFHKAPPVAGFWALKDVSFEVEPGEVVGIKRAQRCREVNLAKRFCFGSIIHVLNQSFLIIKAHSLL